MAEYVQYRVCERQQRSTKKVNRWAPGACVCVRVSVYEYVCTCLHVFLCTCFCVRVYVCVHVQMYAHWYYSVCVCERRYVNVYSQAHNCPLTASAKWQALLCSCRNNITTNMMWGQHAADSDCAKGNWVYLACHKSEKLTNEVMQCEHQRPRSKNVSFWVLCSLAWNVY